MSHALPPPPHRPPPAPPTQPAPPSPSSALAPSPPATVRALPPTAKIEATVTATNRGVAEVRIAGTDTSFTLRTTLPALPEGTRVTLQVTAQHAEGTALRVTDVGGRPLAQALPELQARTAAQNPAAPRAPVSSAPPPQTSPASDSLNLSRRDGLLAIVLRDPASSSTRVAQPAPVPQQSQNVTQQTTPQTQAAQQPAPAPQQSQSTARPAQTPPQPAQPQQAAPQTQAAQQPAPAPQQSQGPVQTAQPSPQPAQPQQAAPQTQAAQQPAPAPQQNQSTARPAQSPPQPAQPQQAAPQTQAAQQPAPAPQQSQSTARPAQSPPQPAQPQQAAPQTQAAQQPAPTPQQSQGTARPAQTPSQPAQPQQTTPQTKAAQQPAPAPQQSQNATRPAQPPLQPAQPQQAAPQTQAAQQPAPAPQQSQGPVQTAQPSPQPAQPQQAAPQTQAAQQPAPAPQQNQSTARPAQPPLQPAQPQQAAPQTQAAQQPAPAPQQSQSTARPAQSPPQPAQPQQAAPQTQAAQQPAPAPQQSQGTARPAQSPPQPAQPQQTTPQTQAVQQPAPAPQQSQNAARPAQPPLQPAQPQQVAPQGSDGQPSKVGFPRLSLAQGTPRPMALSGSPAPGQHAPMGAAGASSALLGQTAGVSSGGQDHASTPGPSRPVVVNGVTLQPGTAVFVRVAAIATPPTAQPVTGTGQPAPASGAAPAGPGSPPVSSGTPPPARPGESPLPVSGRAPPTGLPASGGHGATPSSTIPNTAGIAAYGGTKGPLAPQPAPWVSSNAAQPSAANLLNGTVLPGGAADQTLIRTPAGTLSVAGRIAAPPGTQVSLEVLRAAPLPPPSITAGPASSPMAFSATVWPSMTDALTLLGQLRDPGGMEAARQFAAVLPRADGQMTANVAAFLGAVKAGVETRPWPGSGITKALESAGEKGRTAARQISKDVSEAAVTRRDSAGVEWRVTNLPFHAGGEIQKIQLITRRHGSGDDDGSGEGDGGRKGGGQRFLMNLELSHLGVMQIDGLIRKPDRRFDLIIRTHRPLPQTMRRDLVGVFANAVSAIGLKGALSFNVTPRFEAPAPDPDAPHDRPGLFA